MILRQSTIAAFTPDLLGPTVVPGLDEGAVVARNGNQKGKIGTLRKGPEHLSSRSPQRTMMVLPTHGLITGS